MNCTPVRALGGMMRVPRPGFVHHATSSPSVSAIMEFGFAGAHRQKSARGQVNKGERTLGCG
jgi:hypothetical protein